MASKDLFEHYKLCWDAENEYAETLRSRRNSYAAALVVIAGLGAFQLVPFVSADDTFAVTVSWLRWLSAALILVSLLLFVWGAHFLYTSGKAFGEELELQREYSKQFPDRLPLKRASDLWNLMEDEAEAVEASVDLPDEAGLEAAWSIRVSKMRVALRYMTAGNRRISNRIKTAGVLLSIGFFCLVVAVMAYTVGLNLRDNDASSTATSTDQTYCRAAQEPRQDGRAVRRSGPEQAGSDAGSGRPRSQERREESPEPV